MYIPKWGGSDENKRDRKKNKKCGERKMR